MNANCSKKAMLAIAGDLYLFQPSEATLENLRFWPIRLTIPCDSLSQSSICAWQCKFYEELEARQGASCDTQPRDRT